MNIFKKVPITDQESLNNTKITATERWVHVISVKVNEDSNWEILDKGQFFFTKEGEDLRVRACCQEIMGFSKGLNNITHTYCPKCVEKHYT